MKHNYLWAIMALAAIISCKPNQPINPDDKPDDKKPDDNPQSPVIFQNYLIIKLKLLFYIY